MEKLLRKSDIVLILSLLALAVGMLIAFTHASREIRTPRLQIIVNNELMGTYSLEEDQTIRVGESNICEIKGGQAWMSQADCPDQICVRSRPIGAGGGSIVCLPNRIVMKIVEAGETAGESTDITELFEGEVLDSIAG